MEKPFFRKFFVSALFFPAKYTLTRWKQEGTECHGCIRNESEVGRYSRNPPTQRYVKNMAKTRFLTLPNPTLKTSFRRASRRLLLQM